MLLSALCLQTHGLSVPSTRVLALHRFAVKGLERDELPSVQLNAGEGFPSDRRWALHFDEAKQFDAEQPEWLHKSHFLCAFTAAELLAGFVTTFDDATTTLRVWSRNSQRSDPLLLAARLDEEKGRASAARFFSDRCGRSCTVVTAGTAHQVTHTTTRPLPYPYADPNCKANPDATQLYTPSLLSLATPARGSRRRVTSAPYTWSTKTQ